LEEYSKIISDNRNFLKFLEFCDKIFHSPLYLACLAIVSVLGFIFDREVVSMFILLAAIALNLALCRDMTPSFAATVLIALVPMKYANAPLDDFFVMAYAVVFFIPAIILRFAFFPIKVVKGKNTVPLIIYSLVLIMGGIGSDITFSEYFAFYPVYTVLGLGCLQVIMYLFWQSYTPKSSEKTIRYFCLSMCAIALAAVFLVLATYIEYYAENNPGAFVFIPAVSWKNYISDILMLCMPFAFYLAVKTKYKILFTSFGLLQYLTIICTISAGGILCSTAMMPFLLIILLAKIEKKDRIKLLIVFATLGVAILILIVACREELMDIYRLKIESGGTSRITLYEIAVSVFLKYPVFGAGYGHIEPHMVSAGYIMAYYHSTFFHALATTGIVGLLGYSIMAYSRLRTFGRKYSFNLFLIIGFLGYAAYSMMDIGTAIPFPFVAMTTFMLVVAEKYNSYRVMEETDPARLIQR